MSRRILESLDQMVQRSWLPVLTFALVFIQPTKGEIILDRLGFQPDQNRSVLCIQPIKEQGIVVEQGWGSTRKSGAFWVWIPWQRKEGNLAYGVQRKEVEIARACTRTSKILLLDEPAAAGNEPWAVPLWVSNSWMQTDNNCRYWAWCMVLLKIPATNQILVFGFVARKICEEHQMKWANNQFWGLFR